MKRLGTEELHFHQNKWNEVLGWSDVGFRQKRLFFSDVGCSNFIFDSSNISIVYISEKANMGE